MSTKATFDAQCAVCKKATLGKCFHHAVTCATGPDRNIRHGQACQEVFLFAKTSKSAVRREVRLDGSLRRPGDVYIDRYSGGRDAFMDVAIKSPLVEALVPRSSKDVQALHVEAAANKRNKNQTEALCKAAGKDFIPLIASTYGVWSKEANAVFATLAQRTSALINVDAKILLFKLKQRLAFNILKSNARAILSRCPRDQIPSPGLARRFLLDN